MANIENWEVCYIDVNGVYVGDTSGNNLLTVSEYDASGAVSLNDGMAILGAAFASPQTYTLAVSGATDGQVIRFVAKAGIADVATLTPADLTGGTSITFNADGESVELVYSSLDTTWYITSLNGATIV